MVKFLVVRFSSIGDIILTTPVVRHLKNQVEDSEIHYLTKESYIPLLEKNPYVDIIHPLRGSIRATILDLKEEGIDYIIDLHNNARSARIKFGLKRMDFTVNKLNRQKWLYVNFKWDRMPDLHMVDRNLATIRSFITETDNEGLDYFIPENEEIDLQTLPKPFASGYVGMAIGAQHETKKLPVESLITLCNRINAPVILLGGESDRGKAEEIVNAVTDQVVLNGCGEYSIHQSASLVKQSLLLITHDTGLMHIGAAFGKKIISVWGNTVPKFGMYPYLPDPGSHQFEVEGLACRPCSKIGYQTCPKRHFKCMLEQNLGAIAAKVNYLVQSTGQ